MGPRLRAVAIGPGAQARTRRQIWLRDLGAPSPPSQHGRKCAFLTDTPHISVLLPTFRQAETLLLTLRDLQQQDYPADRWDLVLLEDGSRDVSRRLALACLSFEIEVTVRRTKPNLRYSHPPLSTALFPPP